MEKVLSISVAAYNVEKFIRQCLDSFVSSRLIDLVEVIVTDDGSKDQTPDIVDEYAQKYPRSVILVRQQNAGPGSTVNSGIAHATGKYFRMVDGDDWVNTDQFTKLIKSLQTVDSDAVINNFVFVDNDTGEQRRSAVSGITAGQETAFSEVAEKLDISMHNLIVKTEIMKEHVRLFNGFYTDMQYLVFPTGYIKTVTYLDLDVYMYRISLSTQSMSIPSLQKNIAMHDDVLFSLTKYYEDYIRSEQFDLKIADYILSRTVAMAGCQLSTYLSFAPDRNRKKELYGFFDRLKEASPDIYGKFSRLKTVRVLNLSKALYKPVSVLHRKRIHA